MNRRLKLLQLQPDYNVKRHAFADLAEQIIRGLPEEQYEIVSAYFDGTPAQDQPLSRAARSVYFGFGELGGPRFAALWQLYRFCRAEKFDAVICHRFKAVNMMMTVGLFLRIPLCIGISHGYGEYDRAWRRLRFRMLVRDNWRFVAVSRAVRNYLLGLGCGFTEKNTLAINNAIDIDEAVALQLPKEEARRALGLPVDSLIIGALGRLVPVKGHACLIRAFARIQDHFPQARLAIIGGGREEGPLREEIRRLNLANRVDLLGERPDALQYLRAFDIFAMPSLSEGLPLALMEAMSAGLPLVGSDIPAMRALVSDAGGELISPQDDESLAQALAKYCALSEAERQAKGEAARRYLSGNHNIAQYRREYRALIDQGGS